MKSQWINRQEDGSLVILRSVLDELGLRPDEAASLEVVDGEIRIRPLSRVVEQAQAVFRHPVPNGVSLVDELIADRRREADNDS